MLCDERISSKEPGEYNYHTNNQSSWPVSCIRGLSHILACVAGVLVWKEIGEFKACENVLGARGERFPSFSLPFRALHKLSLVSSILPFLLEDVFLYFFRIDDDASEGACILPARSVPDVGHGV